MQKTFISGGAILTPLQVLPDHTLVIEGGKILAIEAGKIAGGPADRRIDSEGFWVIPGLLDIHTHGAVGYDTMDATTEAIGAMALYFARHGVTGFLPTTVSESKEAIWRAIENLSNCPQSEHGARHLGVHVEGPYLNPAQRGAQAEQHLRAPDLREYERWLSAGNVKFMTLAPELDGAPILIEHGVHQGIEFAVGHSTANYEQVLLAADGGLHHATHIFNGMRGIHHRDPGTTGAILTDDRIYAHVIADGIHLHPAIVKLIIRAKGTSRTILITDSMRATGCPDGKYHLGSETITVRNGIPRTEAGGLAGSTLTMDQALRNVIRFCDLSLGDALVMATITPAEALHLEGVKGVLGPGADADIVLLDQNLHVHMTMIAGKIVFHNRKEIK
jgi:N-acetylglucosamine-6-phosphate deacetylase